MRKIIKTLQFTFLILLFGCASQKSWVYKTNEYQSNSLFSPQRVVVLPFNDARNNLNSGGLGLGYIPLFPFGWQKFDVPEGSPTHIVSAAWVNYNPKEDFAKALAQELNAGNVFKEAFFGYSKENADLAIEGKIISTRFKSKMFTYCLSLWGGVFWYLGAPMCHVVNEMTIELRVKNVPDGSILFSKEYTATPYKKTMWLYGGAKSDFNYSSMLAEVYKRFVEDYKYKFDSPSKLEITKDVKPQVEKSSQKSKADKLRELKELYEQKLR